MLFMGGSALFGGLLALLLPETLGSPMMNSLDELDDISERTKPMLKWWSKQKLEETLERNTRARAERLDAAKKI